MTAAQVQQAARAAGIRIELDGDDLVVGAPAAPLPAVLRLLSNHKAVIIALLPSANDGGSTEEWSALLGERAGGGAEEDDG